MYNNTKLEICDVCHDTISIDVETHEVDEYNSPRCNQIDCPYCPCTREGGDPEPLRFND